MGAARAFAGCVAWLGVVLRLFVRPFRLPLGCALGPEWEGNLRQCPNFACWETTRLSLNSVSHPSNDASARPRRCVLILGCLLVSYMPLAPRSAHEAMCCTRKNTVGERSGAAKLRSGAASRVFACAAQASCAVAQATALAIWTDFGTTALEAFRRPRTLRSRAATARSSCQTS